MKDFIFENKTKIIFGEDKVELIGKELRKGNIKKVLLVYGRNSIKKTGLYDRIINSLKNKNIDFVELSGVKPNPILSKVQEGINIAKDNNVKGILAVGGGSVIDSSKAIAAGFYHNGDIWEAFEKKSKITKALPIYTILTLSATGSEMNGNAVVTNDQTNQKWDFFSKKVYPQVSIIDPKIQSTLPKKQTINGAVDTISHVMEFYFDPTKNTMIQDEISEGIIRTVMKSTEKLLQDENDYESRAELCWSSTLALNGLLSTGKMGGDWSSHMIEHSVSAIHDISHGEGLAIVFPAWLKYIQDDGVEKLDRFAEKIFGIDTGNPKFDAELGITALKDWYRKIGQPVSFSEIKITKEQLIKIAENASQIAPFGKMKKLDYKEILEILNIAY
ncbi:iron-containing alcohol dehydrogenase [Oceanotoga sp. DSM 15011]|jgi:hypothetical protein|uniref:Alcohol dehydrogenase iron-type/glycerol dehydrogenase GldA domain-containing protein n=1 Tax=Oceanotoga teriensis TaxID=515440 RepID=A0AA45HJX9_9BACT|nr:MULTISPECIES: iron-containing alcohol dehydrogenase [Oceanotoga]MDN5343672.1 alcohol dehydrogenase [Oceanotoga sp.]MDO7975344.1 iron-containing alcohol dehydrogenase [Oceanotoga teriensis]PWJ96676.1 hypothetical protein C7380_101251 [Oceanotoga teriensis]UYP00152.1 iron-containing alcohol dehydrogenase [Oceanotoga sp. DSM 15011]